MTPPPTTAEAIAAMSEEDRAVLRWYECGRKVRYDTFLDADNAAWATMAATPVRNNGRNTHLSAYECEWCRGFHFGAHRFSLWPRPPAHRLRAAKRKREWWLANCESSSAAQAGTSTTGRERS